MTDYIIGTLMSIDDRYLYISKDGVGYKILFSKSELDKLIVNKEVKLYTYSFCDFNSPTLLDFGFVDLEKRDMFKMLIRLESVGWKIALMLIDTFSNDQLIDIFKNKTIAELTKLKMIGSYRAKKIINNAQEVFLDIKLTKTKTKILHHLKLLGYKDPEIYEIVANADDNLSYQELINFVFSRIESNQAKN
ncbi:Holliday junction branch migration protein RuvA [Mycoplasma putrefaciens]|uniref:Holliday junction branch migration complex subunit RuvA n=1 Tax=Mycoplasma putrefaciens Mput9231 TaxID=1292033 RepID=M9WH53_9MOLU|nr:Holliday junction branch migration protein RuvA [Mycoplasma putrefaciens]AGJ90719.1 Holliday junction DNA helicase RuvA [Mycoplasma putrefaciens Mput9231]